MLMMVTKSDPEQIRELRLLRREYESSFRAASEPAEKLRLARMIDDLSACLATFREEPVASY
ncbi:hypothetical protein [Candidatus Korobacter versatilis]|uniref:hypothetical protein n=1 Tax=Candidatus Korobacter versatilis TaxID=658062 RepID=UPI00030FD0A3|nr:hypothetical protein [Candidatus Koribacter versatilis]